MKILVVFCVIAYASAWDCSEGQATWCSSLHAAKQCGAVNHCSDTVWKNIPLSQDNSDVCDFCESIVGDVQKMLTNKQNLDKIKTFLEGACAVIPSKAMQQECTTVVDEDLPELLLLISEELDPSLVCGTMGLCKSADIFMRAPKVEQDPVKQIQVAASGDICADCKTFMGDIKDQITSQTTESELEQMIDDMFCALLGELEDTCKQLVAQYVPQILQMLADDVDPAMECAAMGFCTGNAAARVIIPKLKLKKSPLYTTSGMTDDMCGTCKQVINVAKSMTTSQTVEGEIEHYIDEYLCAKLGAYSSLCTTTVKTYLPEIMQLLSSELNPEEDCKALGLCTIEEYPMFNLIQAKITENDIKAMQDSGPKMTRVAASEQCVLCEFVIREIDSLLGQNATEQEIIGALDKVCSVLPSTISDECTDFVNTYGPAVIDLLLQEMSPDVICTTLGLCQNDVVDLSLKDGEYCSICEMVVQYVESLLSENATVKEIEQALDKVCNFLPDQYKSECNDIVNQYTPMLINLIEQELSPEEVCTEIKLCTSEKIIKPTKASLLGDKECTWGPAYWCASKENAAKCKAEKHCMMHVWN